MGKGINTSGEISNGGGDGGSQTNNSTNPRQTENSGGTRGRTRGGEGSKTTKRDPEDNKLPGVKEEVKKVVVEIPKDSDPQPPKQTRGRPPGSTTKNKDKKKPVKQMAAVDPTQFILILQTLSAVIASRPGMEMFALSQKEAENIATPLANILSRNEGVGEVVGNYADHIALLIACATIMIPKYLMYQATQPKKPKKQKEVKMNERNEPTSNPIDREVSGERGNTVTDSENVFKPLSGSINDFLSPIN